jgi:hypothetical protein
LASRQPACGGEEFGGVLQLGYGELGSMRDSCFLRNLLLSEIFLHALRLVLWVRFNCLQLSVTTLNTFVEKTKFANEKIDND